MATKIDRSLDLIAKFNEDGFAEGWAMAVTKSFRQELDIRYTDRMENDHLKEGKKRKVKRWTQGKAFCFEEGHIIYDTPQAYQKWSDAVKHISLACEIQTANPNNEQGQGGRVLFLLHSPNGKADPEILGHHELTQNQFVQFLKTGDFKKAKGR